MDRTAPEPVVLAAQQRSDPRRVSVAAADATSGLADGGVIQFRRIRPTVGDWLTLRTSRDGVHYYTHIDNAHLPAGDYEFRATVPDQAGNLGTGNRSRSGAPEVLHIDPTHVGPNPTDIDRPSIGSGPGEGSIRTKVTVAFAPTVKKPAKRKCRTVRVHGKKRRKCTKVR